MGLFSRNSDNGTGRRSGSRSSVSSEAQANELRSRARRRLVGALALVVAAVIIVPMLLDTSPPVNVAANTPIVVPAIVPPVPEPTLTPSQPDGADAQASGSVSEVPVPDTELAGTPPVDAAVAEPQVAAQVTPRSKPPVTESKPSVNKPVEKTPEHKPESKPKAAERTDDGSVAIALLEGRKPAKSAPAEAAKGSYVLQIAAYTTDKDAQSRRDRLVSSGVSNAYVEAGSAGGKSTYRLRVGPFPSREAAQAAQTRLRALGYDNGFISSK